MSEWSFCFSSYFSSLFDAQTVDRDLYKHNSDIRIVINWFISGFCSIFCFGSYFHSSIYTCAYFVLVFHLFPEFVIEVESRTNSQFAWQPVRNKRFGSLQCSITNLVGCKSSCSCSFSLRTFEEWTYSFTYLLIHVQSLHRSCLCSFCVHVFSPCAMFFMYIE